MAYAENNPNSSEKAGGNLVLPILDQINFRRGERGEGKLILHFDAPNITPEVTQANGKLRLRLPNTRLDNILAKYYDVLDFATPVKSITIQRGENINETILEIQPIAGVDFDHRIYQTDQTLTLEVRPLILVKNSNELAQEQTPEFEGAPLSLNFQTIGLRTLLQLIGETAETNIIVSDSVQGDVALRLDRVPWDQALEVILKLKGLDKRRQGNVILVAPLTEFAERDKAQRQLDQQNIQLAPLRTEFFQMNYAKAEEISKLLGDKANSFLSERGKISVDSRTNTLLVQETRAKLDEIRALIARLDVRVRQVLIESRIVVANDDFSRELGVRFGVSGVVSNGNNGVLTTSGSNNATSTTVSNQLSAVPTPAGRFGSVLDRYNVNLPIANPAGRVALALLGRNYLLDLELQAMQSEGKGELVSSPRILTANGKAASIEQGEEIPYQQNGGGLAGVTSIAFKKAVLGLKATPQITPDNRIIMDLDVTKDSRGAVVSDTQGGSIPAIDTRRIQTQVLVNNGDTVVLGGIYEQRTMEMVTKVPFLGDLPLIGRFFRSTRRENRKTELLIFITPKIIEDK